MTAMQCLVIMPFGEAFDPVFRAVRNTVAGAVPGQPIDCYWLKDVHAAGRITDDIVAGIQKAALCVSDVTRSNPNVMWETVRRQSDVRTAMSTRVGMLTGV